MPLATARQLNKVGFSPKQAEFIVKLYDDNVEPSEKELITAGFTRMQATVLLRGVPPVYAGGVATTAGTKPTLHDLIAVAKFTKAQAELIRAT